MRLLPGSDAVSLAKAYYQNVIAEIGEYEEYSLQTDED